MVVPVHVQFVVTYNIVKALFLDETFGINSNRHSFCFILLKVVAPLT